MVSGFHHIRCSFALVPLHNVKCYPVTLIESFETIGLDGGKMHKNIFPVLALNEPKSFFLIEPLYDTVKTHASSSMVKHNTTHPNKQ